MWYKQKSSKSSKPFTFFFLNFSEMSCLLAALYDKTVRLKVECRKMLEERVTMWEYAAKVQKRNISIVGYTKLTSSLEKKNK